MAKNGAKTNAFGFNPESFGITPDPLAASEAKDAQMKESPGSKEYTPVVKSAESKSTKSEKTVSMEDVAEEQPQKKKSPSKGKISIGEKPVLKGYYLPTDLHTRVKIQAIKEGISASALVQEALERYLDMME